MKTFLTACALSALLPALAPAQNSSISIQTNAPARRGGTQTPFVSPEVHPDHTVTFRFRAPNAKQVSVTSEQNNWKPLEMTKDDRGVWSITTEPWAPDIYAYGFRIDGVSTLDPANLVFKPARSIGESLVDIPSDKPGLQDDQPVPHGVVRLSEYQSKSLGQVRPLRVYTPPGYDQNTREKYPVLFLLHGAGDNEGTWTGQGRTHYILDNLIAQGKARPMIVVMPDGTITGQPPALAAMGTNVGRLRNVMAFERDLLDDLTPFIEKNYRVESGPQNRAIAGLSMGGGQALTIGLRNPDKFAWVCGMSSAVPDPTYALTNVLKDPKLANKQLKLVWFACGRADTLLPPNQQFEELLTKSGIKHEFQEVEGWHEWPVWRKNLATIAPMLFLK